MIKKLISKLIKSKRETEQKVGTVKFFNNSKGFGFITIIGSGEEIFVHKNGLLGKIREKDKVTFNIEKSPKGPNAVNVKRI